MTERIKMNSQSLKKAFPRVYQEFFSRSTIVTSAPGSFIWAGDYSVMEGGFVLLQKLPVRVYVGLAVNTEGGINVNEFEFYNPQKQEFERGSLDMPIRNNLTKFLESYLKDFNKSGLIINVLAEVPPCRGLNMSGAMSVALASALSLYLKKLKVSEFESWKNIQLTDLIRKIDYKFDSVFRLAWKLSTIFHGGMSSGSSAFAPFVYSPYPVIYYSEKRAKLSDVENYSEIRFPKITDGNYHILDQVFYGGLRLEELFNFKTEPNWPIDFGLIYTGDVRMTATTHVTLEEIKDSLKDAANLIKETFTPFLANSPMTPDFFSRINNYGWRSLWNNYINPMSVTSVEVLSAFHNIFRRGIGERAITELFTALNRSAQLFKLINLTSPTMDFIFNYFIEEMHRLGDPYGVALKPVGAGKKGDVLFALAYHGLRDEIFRVIDDMKKKSTWDIALDYASWIDGIEADGVKIEQFLEAKIYSAFVSRGAVWVKHLNHKGLLHADLYTHEEFLKMLPDADLVLDEIAGKIFVRGKQLTSKELHSSVATISILKNLIDKAGDPVANQSLQASSYTLDRNEFQSKIVSPLTKIISTKTKRNLNLKISGGIMNFNIKLGTTGLDIYLVKRIF